uniref:Putative secreted protein n=1 Tax=Anopheles darlingi TaxID=43151 RepID=A0A2M4DKR3_ANODA
MNRVVLCLSALLAIVVAFPAPQWSQGFGGGLFSSVQNGTGSGGFNFSGSSNGTGGSLPDFGSFFPPNLTFPGAGSIPSWANFTGGLPSFFPSSPPGSPLGGGIPFFG